MRKRKTLKNQGLNALDILMVSFGAMIGWGWVISSGEWIQDAGTLGTMFGFLIGGMMIFFIGLVYAELSTAIPVGGCLSFSKRAFGPVISFFCTWMMILGYAGVVCFEACSLPTIVAYLFPNFLQGYLYTIAGFKIYATWLVTALFFAIFIIAINIHGLKTAAIVQNILTVVIGIVGLILIIGSAIQGDINNIKDQLFEGNNAGENFVSILNIATIAPFFLFGFDVIPQTIVDTKTSLKKTGKIMLLSICLAVSFYALVVLSIGYAINSKEIEESLSGSGLVAADAMGKIFNSQIMAKVLILGGLCGVITSWNSFLIGGSRTVSSLSEESMAPSFLSKKGGKNDTPIWSILLIGFLSLIAPFFGQKMLSWISNAASFACCVAYFIVSLSFLVLRYKEPNLKRPYKIKFGKIAGIMATLLSGLMVVLFLFPFTGSTLKQEEFIIIFSWLFIGLLIMHKSNIWFQESKKEIKYMQRDTK